MEVDKQSLNPIENKLVSVIIPVYNGEPYLAEAIESVLAQDYQPIEVIIIDDGSTDDSAEIVKAYPNLRYSHQQHQGLSKALNHGIELSKGAFIAFLDADDYWLDGKLSLQTAHMEERPELDILFGHHLRFTNESNPQTPGNNSRVSSEPLPGYFKGTALIRQEAFHRVGRFDTSLRMGDFIDWFARAKDMGLKYEMMPQTLLMRRIHENTQSQRNQQHFKDYLHILKASLDRRRENSNHTQDSNPPNSTGKQQ